MWSRLLLLPLFAATVSVCTAAESPCVFCEIIAGTRPASIVYRDASVIAFMDRAPRNPGHLLVVPIAHADNILDVPPPTLEHMAAVVQQLARAIKVSDLKAEGIEIRSVTGPAAGQSVFHLHIHVIPRFANEPAPGGAAPSATEIEAAAEKIRSSFVRQQPPGWRPFTKITLPNPRAVAVDGRGSLYIGDVDLDKIYRLAPTGQVTTQGSSGPTITDPIGLEVGRDGSLYVADADANTIYKMAPQGLGVALLATPAAAPGDTSLAAPTAIAVDDAGNSYITNNTGNAILKLTAAGVPSVVAGKLGASGNTDGTGTEARFAKPRGIAIDRAGNLYVADETNSNVRKITPAGVVTTLARGFAAPRALAVDFAGNVYVADTDNHAIRKITPNGVVSTLAGKLGERGGADGVAETARFSEPRGIAVDAMGIVYVADTGNHAIRMITPEGEVKTIAAAAQP